MMAGRVIAVTPVNLLLALMAAAVAMALLPRELDTVCVLDKVSSLAAAARMGTPLINKSPVPNVGNTGAVLTTVGAVAPAPALTTMSVLEVKAFELEKITLDPEAATDEKSLDNVPVKVPKVEVGVLPAAKLEKAAATSLAGTAAAPAVNVRSATVMDLPAGKSENDKL